MAGAVKILFETLDVESKLKLTVTGQTWGAAGNVNIEEGGVRPGHVLRHKWHHLLEHGCHVYYFLKLKLWFPLRQTTW